jgi:NAD(P)-dependent dehydrogenase (short-subunit alcohol dehydrogenase family)
VGRLEGKVALVTGAGSGMGRLAAQRFVEEGACVIAFDLDSEHLEETVSGIKESALPVAGDVSSDADLARAVSAGVERFGRLNVLYNNAGIMDPADESVVDTPDSIWDRTLAVNVKGVAHCCRHGIPELIKAGGGSIINIASFVALVGSTVPQDAYTASKGAVVALTKSLAVQFGPRGIRANAVCPGPIETPLMRELLKDEQKKRVRLNRIPLGRFGTPADVVNVGVHLASDESAWTNGAVIVVDGGITSNYF